MGCFTWKKPHKGLSCSVPSWPQFDKLVGMDIHTINFDATLGVSPIVFHFIGFLGFSYALALIFICSFQLTVSYEVPQIFVPVASVSFLTPVCFWNVMHCFMLEHLKLLTWINIEYKNTYLLFRLVKGRVLRKKTFGDKIQISQIFLSLFSIF